MGTLRSRTYMDGMTLNGITLGTPVVLTMSANGLRPQQPGDRIDDLFWCWDDAAIPSGTLNDDGTVTPDAE